MVAQAVRCTNPRGTIHAHCDMSGALLELDNLIECQLCLRVSQKPQICVEQSRLVGAACFLGLLFHLFTYWMDKGVSPKIRAVSHCFFGNSLMWCGGRGFTLHSLRMGGRGARAEGAVI